MNTNMHTHTYHTHTQWHTHTHTFTWQTYLCSDIFKTCRADQGKAYEEHILEEKQTHINNAQASWTDKHEQSVNHNILPTKIDIVFHHASPEQTQAHKKYHR